MTRRPSRDQELIELTQDLVRAPTPNPPGDERPAVEVLKRFVATLPGVRVHTFVPAPRRVSLIATSGKLPPTLLLSAHTDTHPITGKWKRDGLSGDLARGRIFGRGTTDNKGAVAAMACAFGRLVTAHAKHRGRLIFLANADEETGGRYGVEALCARWDERPDAAVVAEPSGIASSWERLWIAARGTSRFEIDVSGTPTHSSLAGHEGVRSAVEGLDAVLIGMRRRLDVLRHTPRRNGLPSRLTVVAVDGGVGWGVVPGRASARCELRLLPGNDQKRIEASVRKAFAASVGEAGVTGQLKFADGGLRWMAPSSVPIGSQIVRASVNGWRSVVGRTPRFGCFPGGTDARLLQAAGVPSVIIGPGALARAHHPDEYVTVAELSVAQRLYERIAGTYLDWAAAG